MFVVHGAISGGWFYLYNIWVHVSIVFSSYNDFIRFSQLFHQLSPSLVDYYEKNFSLRSKWHYEAKWHSHFQVVSSGDASVNSTNFFTDRGSICAFTVIKLQTFLQEFAICDHDDKGASTSGFVVSQNDSNRLTHLLSNLGFRIAPSRHDHMELQAI